MARSYDLQGLHEHCKHPPAWPAAPTRALVNVRAVQVRSTEKSSEGSRMRSSRNPGLGNMCLGKPGSDLSMNVS